MSKTVISETLSLTSRKGEVIKACEQAIMRGLEAIGEVAEGYAKDDCPVDTGRLRASISNKAVKDELAVYIGTNVEYAPYVEYRDIDHKTGKAHFLRDAAADHSEEYKKIMKASLEAGATE
jgi:hypothetical protein